MSVSDLFRVYICTAGGSSGQIEFMRSSHSDHVLTYSFRCGFATIHSVEDMSQEDRMESFFLSETLKYLYLVSTFLQVVKRCLIMVNVAHRLQLFDESHPLNVHEEDYIFTTQAHILPITRLRKLADTLPNSPFNTLQFANQSVSVGQLRATQKIIQHSDRLFCVLFSVNHISGRGCGNYRCFHIFSVNIWLLF